MTIQNPSRTFVQNDDDKNFGSGFAHFNHNFLDSNLFSDQKLAELIERYPREYYMITTMTQAGDKPEWRNGDLNGVSGQFAMDAIKSGRLWMCLRRLDLVAPEYDALVNDAIAEKKQNNPALKTSAHKSCLLISSPGARVLYHCDIPMVALWHIRGRKRVWLYDADNKTHLPDETLEGIVLRETEEEIPYSPDWDADARSVVLEPGRALSWPHNAPHRVDNLDELNVSITTDFFTPDTMRRYGVSYFNGLLRRRLNIAPRSTSSKGPIAYAKLGAAFIAKKAKISSPQEREMIQSFKLNPENPGKIIDLTPTEQVAIEQL